MNYGKIITLFLKEEKIRAYFFLNFAIDAKWMMHHHDDENNKK